MNAKEAYLERTEIIIVKNLAKRNIRKDVIMMQCEMSKTGQSMLNITKKT